jgi:hypothetical protein
LFCETVFDGVESSNAVYAPETLVELLRDRVVEQPQDAMEATVRNVAHAALG